MLNTEHLYQLAAFARQGSLSRAAEELHTSQPSLTRSMAALEAELNVALFDRAKNRLTLNDTGRLAVERAEAMLAALEDMKREIQTYDRAHRSTAFGACAPLPLRELEPLIRQCFPGRTVRAEMRDSDDALWEGLRSNRYQIIAVHKQPPEDSGYFWFPYRRENLSLLVPQEHPLAHRKAVSLRDLEGQHILLYSQIGFWREIHSPALTGAHYLYMDERGAFGKVAEASDFPSFISDAHPADRDTKNRVILPIEDDAVHVTYYFVCKATEEPTYHKLIALIRKSYPFS